MQVNNKFSVGDVISFSVFHPSILGTGFNRVKVLAVLDADTAKLMGIDPIALHAAIYPFFEPVENKTTYKKYNDYLYVKLQMPNGDITALGLPWMNMDSVVVVVSTTARYTITLDNPGEINTIVNILNANGFHNIMVETL